MSRFTAIDRAREAFIEEALGYDKEWEFPDIVRTEAFCEAVAVETSARRLLAAVEAFKAEINALDHVGKMVSSPEELTQLIIDYEMDQVGHSAAAIMSATIKVEPNNKPSLLLQIAREMANGVSE